VLKEIEDRAQKTVVEDGSETTAMLEETDLDRFRDQGFTRPTVLVLLPNRGLCHKFVDALMKMTGADRNSPHFERFDAEFGRGADADDDEDGETPLDSNKELRRKAVLESKGKDWNEIFGDDLNQDDDFKLGIALTPKAAKSGKADNSTKVQVKLYTDFYKSDIVVCSPIGLKILLAPDEDGKEGDSDFLSSIEICLVQHADVLMMQNWDHASDILSRLNEEPTKNNDTDFSRVRRYMLEGQGAQRRQLIISTDIVDPYLLSAFKRFGKSVAGSVKMRRKTSPEEAALANVLVPMKQVFQRVPVVSFDKQTDGRTQYFVKNILPEIQRHKQKQTMIYIPSYFDFVALRNIFLKREIAFVSVHEYSRHTEVSRGRARFLQGRKPIMLYTGRANFFHRHAIKGIRHLIFLGLPEHPQFYADHVNLINTATSLDENGESVAGSSCLALFTRFEGHALERIVGSANSSRMITSDKATFMFHS
jgi:U3 small nucleolar RNA-associated protein 25